MGIHDRDYYREDGSSSLGYLDQRGRVCTGLIVLNVACFALQYLTRTATPGVDNWLTYWCVLDVNRVLHGEVWRLLTYAFLHDTGAGAPWHIVFNMLFLWWFGPAVEQRRGSREFLAFYLVSAVVAGLAFCLESLVRYQFFPTPYFLPSPLSRQALGASGAVTAVLVLAAIYNPRQVIYLFFVIPIPIWGFVVFSVLKDALELVGNPNSGVAVSAHLGGAAFAFAYYRLGWGLVKWLPSRSSRSARGPGPRLRLYPQDEEETPAHVPAASPREENLEEQVDAILEKILLIGKDNLTDREREILQRASEAARRRRH
jgi:membrane associated rhomboid family serine protease